MPGPLPTLSHYALQLKLVLLSDFKKQGNLAGSGGGNVACLFVWGMFEVSLNTVIGKNRITVDQIKP